MTFETNRKCRLWRPPQSHLLSKGQAQMKTSQNECCCQAGQLFCFPLRLQRQTRMFVFALSLLFCLFVHPRTLQTRRVHAWHSQVSTLLCDCQRPFVLKKLKMPGMNPSLHLPSCHLSPLWLHVWESWKARHRETKRGRCHSWSRWL